MHDPDPPQRHYPTYQFKERDIVLAEYTAAAQVQEAEERLFTNSANVTLVVAAGLGSLALGRIDALYGTAANYLSQDTIAGLLIFAVLAFSTLSVLYFADRQRTIILAKRKVVVLRAMLGLSYGGVQLVLPQWRVEGATNPFAIRFFPGWRRQEAYPFWVITSFAALLLLFIVADYASRTALEAPLSPQQLGFAAAAIWTLVLAVIYRSTLFDSHGSWRLSVTKVLSAVLRIRLVPDFEYVIYRAKLAVDEAERLGIDLAKLYEPLLFIEDKAFYAHRGVSLRGIARAGRDRILRKRRSGGSTITQQLVRSLFIVDLKKVYRRKIVEIALAFWAEQHFSKRQILDLYLTAVRFDDGVFGWPAAMKAFFGGILSNPTPAQAFVAIERVANIQGRVLAPRIANLARGAAAEGVLPSSESVVPLYEQLVVRDITSDCSGVQKLRELLETEPTLFSSPNVPNRVSG